MFFLRENNDKSEVQNVFLNKIQEFGLTEKEAENFFE